MVNYLKKKKDKNHIIIPIDTEKAFDKIQHPFMVKALNKLIDWNFLNLIKNIHEKPTANIILTKERLKYLLLKSRTRRCIFLLLLFKIVLKILARETGLI